MGGTALALCGASVAWLWSYGVTWLDCEPMFQCGPMKFLLATHGACPEMYGGSSSLSSLNTGALRWKLCSSSSEGRLVVRCCCHCISSGLCISLQNHQGAALDDCRNLLLLDFCVRYVWIVGSSRHHLTAKLHGLLTTTCLHVDCATCASHTIVLVWSVEQKRAA